MIVNKNNCDEVEQKFIGDLLLDLEAGAEVFPEIRREINLEHFTNRAARTVCNAILKLWDEGKPISRLILFKNGTLERAGGINKVNSWIDTSRDFTIPKARDYLKDMKETYTLEMNFRRMMAAQNKQKFNKGEK